MVDKKNLNPHIDTPMYCSKCKKTVRDSGNGDCPKGGNHHLMSMSDKDVQGQGAEEGMASKKNKKPDDPHSWHENVPAKTSSTTYKDEITLATVAHYRDPIRLLALQYTAHDSGDNQTVFHCPFDGGGKVTGRSDGTIECSFCGTCFTVQVQPEQMGMPQTIDGQMNSMPGMPNNSPSSSIGDDPNADPSLSGDPSMNQSSEFPPDGSDDGSPQDEEDQGKNGSDVPWEHQSSRKFYLTAQGALKEDEYIKHIALKFADNRDKVLKQIKSER